MLHNLLLVQVLLSCGLVSACKLGLDQHLVWHLAIYIAQQIQCCNKSAEYDHMPDIMAGRQDV